MKKYGLILTIFASMSLGIMGNTMKANAVENTANKTNKDTRMVSTNAKEFQELKNISTNKVFKIKFNFPIDFTTINEDTIKVVDSNDNVVSVKYAKDSDNKNIVKVMPPQDGYELDKSYTLEIHKGIKSLDNRHYTSNESYMKFTVSEKATEDTDIDVSSRADIKTLLNDYRGGKNFYNEQFTSPRESYSYGKEYKSNPEKYEKALTEYMKPLYKGMPENAVDWYFEADEKSGEYADIRHKFNEKYLNKKYADITDMNYFTKMKTNLDFSKVNNQDVAPIGSYGGMNSFLRHDVNKNSRGSSLKFEGIDMTKDIRLQYIWRPDVEKELITLLNAERKRQGLGELEFDNDLKAMAMYATKKAKIFSVCNWSNKLSQSILVNTPLGLGESSTRYSKFRNKIAKEAEINNTNTTLTGQMIYSYGVPLTDKNNDYNYWGSLYLNEACKLPDGQPLYLPYNELAKKLGYTNGKNVTCIGGSSGNIGSAKDVMKIWNSRDFSFYRSNEKIDGEPNELKPNNKFGNPKLKKIGIAVTYSIPKTPLEGQGIMDVAILLSE